MSISFRLLIYIEGAGGAAHLPGMVAALTPLPVIGVPVALKYLDGLDSLLSIVQMPVKTNIFFTIVLHVERCTMRYCCNQ